MLGGDLTQTLLPAAETCSTRGRALLNALDGILLKNVSSGMVEIVSTRSLQSLARCLDGILIFVSSREAENISTRGRVLLDA